jgi:hypothetical protein
LVARASRSVGRSPWSVLPPIRFLFVTPKVSLPHFVQHSLAVGALRITRIVATNFPEDFHLQVDVHARETIGIGSRRGYLAYCPPTPPDMWVRIRRFSESRLALRETWEPEEIEIHTRRDEARCDDQRPPPVRVAGSRRGDVLGHLPSRDFTEDRGASLSGRCDQLPRGLPPPSRCSHARHTEKRAAANRRCSLFILGDSLRSLTADLTVGASVVSNVDVGRNVRSGRIPDVQKELSALVWCERDTGSRSRGQTAPLIGIWTRAPGG